MSIPKIIHYCWFGNSEIPEKEKMCIESWKEFFPDYEIKFWNEENFDFKQCKFAQQAYDCKKYAFVSDYVRAKVLYEYGGIYMDTDVKIIRQFPKSDAINGFMGFERKRYLGTAVMATVPKNDNIKKLLEHYETHDFLQKDGGIDNIANVFILTGIMTQKGLVTGGKHQEVDGFEVFNREVFFPKKQSDTEFGVTEETSTIHLYSCSWLSEREIRRGKNKIWIKVVRPMLSLLRDIGEKLIGKNKIRRIEIKLRNKLR